MRLAETSEPIRLDQPGTSLIGRFPIAIIVSLVLQAGLFIWWAAAMSARFDERLNHLQDRTQRLELNLQRSGENIASLLDRLARAEEKISIHSERVRRIEQAH